MFNQYISSYLSKTYDMTKECSQKPQNFTPKLRSNLSLLKKLEVSFRN